MLLRCSGTTSSRLPTTLTNVAIPTTRRMLHLCLPGIISEFARVDSKLGLTPRTLIFTDTKLEATEVVSSVPRDSRVGKLAALTGDFSQVRLLCCSPVHCVCASHGVAVVSSRC
jgi:hypothetical protein